MDGGLEGFFKGVVMSQKVFTIYDMFLTSDSMEKEGIILTYGCSEFVVARAGGKNKLFLESRDKYIKNFKKGDDESSEDFVLDVWISSVFKSWKNVHDKKGKQLEFTPENVRKVMKDLPDLFIDIRVQTQDFQKFRERVVDEAEKN
jgi:hypothetical protein